MFEAIRFKFISKGGDAIQNTTNPLNASFGGLGFVAACVITLFTTPYFTALSEDWAVGILVSMYGSAYGYLLGWSWFFICGAAIFCLSRAVLTMLIQVKGALLAERFMAP